MCRRQYTTSDTFHIVPYNNKRWSSQAESNNLEDRQGPLMSLPAYLFRLWYQSLISKTDVIVHGNVSIISLLQTSLMYLKMGPDFSMVCHKLMAICLQKHILLLSICTFIYWISKQQYYYIFCHILHYAWHYKAIIGQRLCLVVLLSNIDIFTAICITHCNHQMHKYHSHFDLQHLNDAITKSRSQIMPVLEIVTLN